MAIDRQPGLEALAAADTVLIAGAGGGFDLYCGLPAALWLESQGKTTVLASLAFTYLQGVDEPWIRPGLKQVGALSDGEPTYFPKKYLCQWFAGRGEERSVYCFEKTGVRTLVAAYQHIVERHGVDAVLLVDGGTDSLMRGDESGLGTPHEDMLSVAAVDELEVPTKLLACLGFGVDAYHGVCHARFLEAVAELARSEGFLGAFSLLPEMPESAAYIDAVDYACRQQGQRPSIVNNSIAAAMEGHYGDYHRADIVPGSTLWINPLMSLYWFDHRRLLQRRPQASVARYPGITLPDPRNPTTEGGTHVCNRAWKRFERALEKAVGRPRCSGDRAGGDARRSRGRDAMPPRLRRLRIGGRSTAHLLRQPAAPLH